MACARAGLAEISVATSPRISPRRRRGRRNPSSFKCPPPLNRLYAICVCTQNELFQCMPFVEWSAGNTMLSIQRFDSGRTRIAIVDNGHQTVQASPHETRNLRLLRFMRLIRDRWQNALKWQCSRRSPVSWTWNMYLVWFPPSENLKNEASHEGTLVLLQLVLPTPYST